MPGKRGGARAGAGRPRGSVSKAKLEIAGEAKKHAGVALNTLVEIARDKDAPPPARVSAAQAILDRGYGRPSTVMEGGDNPIRTVNEIILRAGTGDH